MKIIPQITPDPPTDLKDQMKDLLQEFAERALTEMQNLEQKLQHSQGQQTDQITKHSLAITQLAEELGQLKKALNDLQEPPRPDPIVPDALNAITREITKLTGEMSALRKAVAEFKLPAPEPKPEPLKIIVSPPAVETPAPVAAAPSFDFMTLMNEPPKKVALLTKLWDYLNQVAFEIPLGKQSH